MTAQHPGKGLTLAKRRAKKGILEGPLAMMSDSLLLMVSVAILADLKSNRARQLFANTAHASPHPPECRQPSTRNSLTSLVAAAPFKLISTESEIHIPSAERGFDSQSRIVFELFAGIIVLVFGGGGVSRTDGSVSYSWFIFLGCNKNLQIIFQDWCCDVGFSTHLNLPVFERWCATQFLGPMVMWHRIHGQPRGGFRDAEQEEEQRQERLLE
jgi:hypothetical protein